LIELQRIKALIRPKILLPALGIALLLSLCGKFVFPEMFSAETGQAGVIPPAAGFCLILTACLSAIYLFSLLFAEATDGERKAFAYFKGFLPLLLIEFAAMPVVSALYGLLAVLIQAAAKP
jgi:hypothetical protein